MSEPDGPIVVEGKDDGGEEEVAVVRVCAQECETCIFRPGNLMNLRPGRLRSMVDDAQSSDSTIVCHKTLEGERAICRGWYDRYSGQTIMGRLARMRPAEIDPDR